MTKREFISNFISQFMASYAAKYYFQSVDLGEMENLYSTGMMEEAKFIAEENWKIYQKLYLKTSGFIV